MNTTIFVIANILTVLLILLFILTAARGLLDPKSASARYGMQVTDKIGAAFYRVYISRNIVIVAITALFLVFGYRQQLAITMTLITLLPLFDLAMVRMVSGGKANLSFHILSLVLIGVNAGLLWFTQIG
ncbi:MAG: DUF4267 domain-containing protein [Candidatus Saccharimonas sp.]